MFQGLSWKNLLLTFLGILCPIVFDEIIKADPTFPLSNEMFTDLVIYLIGFLVGGWNLVQLAIQKMIYEKYGETYAEWLKK